MLKMSFNKHNVTAMHVKLAAARERVHKLILVKGAYRLPSARSNEPSLTAREDCSLKENRWF